MEVEWWSGGVLEWWSGGVLERGSVGVFSQLTLTLTLPPGRRPPDRVKADDAVSYRLAVCLFQ